jgi:hypothetical protein
VISPKDIPRIFAGFHVMNKMKLALETFVLLIHLITGVFVGYINSIGETQVVITSSIILYSDYGCFVGNCPLERKVSIF